MIQDTTAGHPAPSCAETGYRSSTPTTARHGAPPGTPRRHLAVRPTEPVADDRLDLAPFFPSCLYELPGRWHPQTLGNAKGAQVHKGLVGARRYTVALLLCGDGWNAGGDGDGLHAPRAPQGNSSATMPARRPGRRRTIGLDPHAARQDAQQMASQSSRVNNVVDSSPLGTFSLKDRNRPLSLRCLAGQRSRSSSSLLAGTPKRLTAVSGLTAPDLLTTSPTSWHHPVAPGHRHEPARTVGDHVVPPAGHGRRQGADVDGLATESQACPLRRLRWRHVCSVPAVAFPNCRVRRRWPRGNSRAPSRFCRWSRSP